MIKMLRLNRIFAICIAGILLAGCGGENKKSADVDGRAQIPNQRISLDSAKILTNDYVKTRSGIVNRGLGFEDNREFWFSLDVMEDYIKYVREESAKKGYKNPGIRIYNAAYPKGSKFPQPGYSTVVLVPTHEVAGEKGNANNFFPVPPPNENSEDMDGLNYGNGGVGGNGY